METKQQINSLAYSVSVAKELTENWATNKEIIEHLEFCKKRIEEIIKQIKECE